jgi:hypothetical protein
MRALPVVLLLLAACAVGQDSRPATAPSSDDPLRMLAGSVMQERIAKSMKEIAAFGSLCKDDHAAAGAEGLLVGQMQAAGLTSYGMRASKPLGVTGWFPLDGEVPSRQVILMATLSAETASAASALLEAARVLPAVRKTAQIADLGFAVGFELHLSADDAAWGIPGPNVQRLAELRFGDLAPDSKECFRLTVAAPESRRADLMARIEHVLKQFKGEKGFWKDFDIRPDANLQKDGVPRIMIGSPTRSESRPAESRPESGPAKKDVLAAVRAARFALMLVARLAERPR